MKLILKKIYQSAGWPRLNALSKKRVLVDEPHLMAEVLDTCGNCFLYKVRDALEEALGVKFRRERR